MTAQLSISAAPPADPGLNFEALISEGLASIRELAGQVWTDHNEHDPGITTLEQLAFALTELSYRAGFPVPDLLADPATGRLDPRQQGLAAPSEIFPMSPVTVNDIRRLLVDRVVGAANAWVEPAGRGLYDITIYAPGDDGHVCPPSPGADRSAVQQQAHRAYHAHRALGEDVRRITVLKPVPVGVRADVWIDDSAPPEAILAELLFRIGNLLAPEVRRRPLDAALARGADPAALLTGPWLHHGLIDDADLGPRPGRPATFEVARTMSGTPGVLSVHGVELDVGPPPVDATSIAVLAPDQVERGGITLTRGGGVVRLSNHRVVRLLEKRWAEGRRTYDLDAQCRELLGFPPGVGRRLDDYSSVQRHFPGVYGIGDHGLPGDAPESRRIAAEQFKGYLLVYDQLLANFLSQVAGVRDLFSVRRDLEQTHFWQHLNATAVPGFESLIMKEEEEQRPKRLPAGGYRDGLPALMKGGDRWLPRRNRVAEFLLALYGQAIDPGAVASAGEGQEAGLGLLRARLDLLDHVAAISGNRARGPDVAAPSHPGNISGLEMRARLDLGMEPARPQSFTEALGELGLDLAPPGVPGLAQPLGPHETHIGASFAPVPATAPRDAAAPRPVEVLQGRSVTPELLGRLARGGEFRYGTLPGGADAVVVFRVDPADEWVALARYRDSESAAAGAPALTAAFVRLAAQSRQLYVVEDVLLRDPVEDGLPAAPEAPAVAPDPPEVATFDDMFGGDDTYTGDGPNGLHVPVPVRSAEWAGWRPHTITAVVSTCGLAEQRAEYHRFVAGVLRRYAPAHLAVRVCLIDTRSLVRFELLWTALRSALRGGDREARRAAAGEAQRFLRERERPLPDLLREVR